MWSEGMGMMEGWMYLFNHQTVTENLASHYFWHGISELDRKDLYGQAADVPDMLSSNSIWKSTSLER